MASTDIALKLLNDLHKKFKNWDLAFAAYNAGSQCILKVLHKNPTALSINDLDIPLETKNYVNRIKQIHYSLGAMNV